MQAFASNWIKMKNNTGSSEIRCALIKVVGSDVHEGL